MIYIAGISIALFTSALLLLKKDKSTADYFLLLWMLLNVAHLGFHYLNFVGTLFDYPQILGIQLPFPLFQGVALYFYVSSVTNQSPQRNWHYLLHLIPAILAYLYMISFFTLPAAEKIEIFKQKGGEDYALFMSILQIAVFVSGFIYVVWCSWLLIQHKKNIISQFSDIEDISLSWLQFLVYGLGIVWCFVIFTQSDVIIYQAVSVFVILIGFFGVQQKNIFNKVEQRFKEPQEIKVKEKYLSSGLSEENSDKQYEKLTQLMEQDQLYKNANLSLRDLAKELNLHPNYLSQIINEKGGVSFYDYINTYRVEEFKKLIEIPENKKFTLMSLALDCGFNSKSSFNRNFKKITGQIPSQFVKK